VYDDRWSEAIAVGSLAFVESVKNQLDAKAARRGGGPKEVLDFTMEGSIKPLVPTVGTAFLNPLPRLILSGAAYETGVYSYQEIAKEFGVHFNTVGRIVR
jgi:hypothetical protein